MALPLGGRAWPLPWYFLMLLSLGWFLSRLLGIETDASVDELEDTISGKPNILLLVADDLGYNDTSAFAESGIETPALEQIAQQGVRFHRHYAHSTCSPSRVALLTGRHAERFGFRHGGLEIPPEITTLPEALRAQGYSTHLVGKWHAGEAREQSLPLAQGFDSYFGFHNQWALSGRSPTGEYRYVKPTYINPFLRDGKATPQQYQGHLTDILSERTKALIESMAGKDSPWFIYHGFLAPHAPIEVEAHYAKQFPDTPEGRYRALVKHLDDTVAGFMRQLEETGQLDNTVIVFVSDNGGTNLERDNNYPFYGRKSETYEGSLRTPLMIRLPKLQAAGEAVNAIVMNTDIYPTILALAGTQATESLDGKNLMPLLMGESIESRVLSWDQYLWNIDALSYSLLDETGRWRLSSMYGLEPKLFDLQANPAGGDDVADQNPAVVKALTDKYRSNQRRLARFMPRQQQRDEKTFFYGWDMQRTPLYYGFTLGLGFALDKLNESAAKSHSLELAAQGALWSLIYDEDDGLLLTMGEAELHGGKLTQSDCQAIVISGNYQPPANIAPVPQSYRLKLYVGDQLRDITTDVPNLNRRLQYASEPTVVSAGGNAIFLSMPVSSPTEMYHPERLEPETHDLFIQSWQKGVLEQPRIQSLLSQLCDK